jgi:hypothetical protein
MIGMGGDVKADELLLTSLQVNAWAPISKHARKRAELSIWAKYVKILRI